MWDSLFGKPKKRYYKPKKKLVKQQNEVAKKAVDISKENKKSLDLQLNEINTNAADVWKNPSKEKTNSKNGIKINNAALINKLQQKTVVNIEIYDNLVMNLKKEMNNVFLSAFLARIDDGSVLKSWFMKDEQSLLLSEIFVKTNQFLFNQSQSKIKSYYILDLDEHKLLFTLKLDTYQFAMILNGKEASVGCLMNIVKPIIEENIKNN